jgi:hypothetical protein
MLAILIYLSYYTVLEDLSFVKNYILLNCLLYGLLSFLSRLKHLDLSSYAIILVESYIPFFTTCFYRYSLLLETQNPE